MGGPCANDNIRYELHMRHREAELDAEGEKALTARAKTCELCNGAITLFFSFESAGPAKWQVICDDCKMAGPIRGTAKEALYQWNRLRARIEKPQKKKRVA